MKSLEQFWRWFDNEKPSPFTALVKARENLSPLAGEALAHARQMIHDRGVGWGALGGTVWALETYPQAMR